MIVWVAVNEERKNVVMVGKDYAKVVNFIEKNLIVASVEILRLTGLDITENDIVKGRFSVLDETGLRNEIECEGWFYKTPRNRPLVILQRWELEDD